MAIYIHAVRIYLDSIPSIANASDIGLYAVTGENSVFRWIESNITSYSPTYTWKPNVLKPAPFSPIQESVDLLVGGNLPTIGGNSIEVVNTISYGGTMTQLDYILNNNDIRLNGLRADIIRFEISGGALIEADGEILFRGICGDPVWDEKQFTIPLETALLKRKANLATIINEDDYPDSSPDIRGQCIPVTFGEFKPEFDNENNPIWNGYAKFVRVANQETIYKNASRRTVNENDNLDILFSGDGIGYQIFPVIDNDGDIPPLMYKIKLSNGGVTWRVNDVIVTSGTYDLPYFEDMYIYVIEGTGEGKYRKITKAQVVLDDVNYWDTIEITLADYFGESLAGNETATAVDQSWIEIIEIARQYQSDVWSCKDYLDENGNKITTGLNLYSYLAEQKAKVTTENTDAIIEVLPLEFYRLPQYAYEDSGNTKNNLLDIDVSLFKNDPDSMNSFLIKPVTNVRLSPDSATIANAKWQPMTEGINYKIADGFYQKSGGGNTTVTEISGYINHVTDKNSNTSLKWRFNIEFGDYYYFILLFDLPEIPNNFRYDNVYLGIKFTVKPTYGGAAVYSAENIYIKTRKFLGDSTEYLDFSGIDNNKGAVINNLLDSYYDNNVSTKNKNFYYSTEYDQTINGITYTILPGYSSIEITGIDTIEKYNAIHECALIEVNLSVENVLVDYYISELAAIFGKAISIKDAMYSPFRGRIYNSQWGQQQGSSSYSSSSSSSLSSSLSSSSQSSPSSSSSSSQSSPSSSSSSSESCDMGVGRKNACAMINNPIDILEHTLRLQNWSEQNETKEWGKEYANVPLIDISTNEGGFDYEDLNPVKALRPARQILNYNDAYTDEIARSLCKQFFLCNYQNPSTGNESVAFIGDKSLSTPATIITLSDIIGSIGEVQYSHIKGVYCEPIVKYCKNNANGKYEKIIQITNTNKSTYDSSYVIGLSGSDAEMAWARAHILWEAYRQVEPAPNDMVNCDWIVTDSDAVWYLDTWLTYMGAINTDGTTSGITFEPKKRIAFSVSYETGKNWFLTQHHRLQLPHQTNDTAIEFLIEKISKNIVMGKELVSIQAMLYGEVSDIAMYVQDTYDAGTLLADWQDDYETQAEDATQGADIQDIT